MVSDAIPVAADVTGRTGSVMTEGMAAGRHGNRLGELRSRPVKRL